MAARGTKGRGEKIDQEIRIDLDNRHNVQITQLLESKTPNLVWSNVVRDCMVKAEHEFVTNPHLIDFILSQLEKDGLVSGEKIRRKASVSDSFKKHFTILCFNLGYDLSEYIIAAVYLYLPLCVAHPSYMAWIASEWKRNNGPDGGSVENCSPYQTHMFGGSDRGSENIKAYSD